MISRYDEYRRGVEEELRGIFEGREGFLYKLLRYHLGWVDPEGRPQEGATAMHFQGAMALACSEALGGDFRPALPAAAGVELVHHFTLVHGEVQAGRAEDADRPSIWWVWGPAQAINAGDGLHALGRKAMMRMAAERHTAGVGASSGAVAGYGMPATVRRAVYGPGVPGPNDGDERRVP